MGGIKMESEINIKINDNDVFILARTTKEALQNGDFIAQLKEAFEEEER
jgi:hypothetical protein